MSVDRDEVDRIARLARLDLEDDEADRLTDDMNRILEYAERLRTAGLENAPSAERPADKPTGISGMEGARGETGEPDALDRGPSAFAPAFADGFFVVPPPPGVTAEADA